MTWARIWRRMRSMWKFLVTERLGYLRPQISAEDERLRHEAEQRLNKLEAMLLYLDVRSDLLTQRHKRHHS